MTAMRRIKRGIPRPRPSLVARVELKASVLVLVSGSVAMVGMTGGVSDWYLELLVEDSGWMEDAAMVRIVVRAEAVGVEIEVVAGAEMAVLPGATSVLTRPLVVADKIDGVNCVVNDTGVHVLGSSPGCHLDNISNILDLATNTATVVGDHPVELASGVAVVTEYKEDCEKTTAVSLPMMFGLSPPAKMSVPPLLGQLQVPAWEPPAQHERERLQPLTGWQAIMFPFPSCVPVLYFMLAGLNT